MNRWRLFLATCGAALLALGCSQPAPAPSGAQASAASASQAPEKIGAKHLPNAIRLHEKVISGGQPDGDAGFAELAELGVRTVISVDGAAPDLAGAKKHGLRYVHLPHGYDGIPEERAKELAKAVRDLPGPIYIHCHHGKHRSPAAATVACVSAGFLQPAAALGVLKTAGTSENYRGLYQSAEHARRLDDALLDALVVEFRETEQLPPLAEAMVAVERTFDHLKGVADARWRPTPEHPDIDPPHEALLLREHFTELLRTDEVQQKPERFQQLLVESEAAANELESALRAVSEAASADVHVLNQKLEAIAQNCAACHKEFRDVPLGEK